MNEDDTPGKDINQGCWFVALIVCVCFLASAVRCIRG